MASLDNCTKKCILDANFATFVPFCCQYFLMHSFRHNCFFLACNGYAISTKSSEPSCFVKMEPSSPLANDSSFTYACNIVEATGSKPGHVVELPFWYWVVTVSYWIEKFYMWNGNNSFFCKRTSPFPPCHSHAKFHEKLVSWISINYWNVSD